MILHLKTPVVSHGAGLGPGSDSAPRLPPCCSERAGTSCHPQTSTSTRQPGLGAFGDGNVRNYINIICNVCLGRGGGRRVLQGVETKRGAGCWVRRALASVRGLAPRDGDQQ